jgi:dihydroneopterin aldolase
MVQKPRCQLEIRAYHTLVRLGVTPAERETAQAVEFGVRLRFSAEPAATRSDRIEDTLSYADLCAVLDQLVEKQEYHLIEALGRQAYEALRARIQPTDLLEVTVHKLRPPIENLRGGALFVYGDELR